VALFVIERDSGLPPAEAWRRLTAWERHSATVPLTRIEVLTPPPSGIGTRFAARTRLGPAAFSDPMRVEVWEPPDASGYGRCRLVKTGRVVIGWAEIEVAPAAGGCRVRWREDARVRWVPPLLFDPPTALGGRLVFGRVVDTLLRQPT
jgi:hypothetical protein